MESALRRVREAELICFDNDGTLFRSEEVANPAIQRQFVRFVARHGLDLPPPDDAAILALTGSPGPVFYKEILPPALRHLSQEFRDACIDEEVREVRERGRFFDGAESMLLDLRARGRRIALVTNGGDRYIGAVAERLDYARHLDGIYHFGKDGLQTKAAMIHRAIADLGGPAVMVGDRRSDREAAEETQVPFVGCSFGYAAPDELDGVPLLARSIDDVRRWLLG
ncbi:MAG: haloacid dehalogenase-like hydrolase [Candidatus Eisenbacteria bacterium]